MTSRPVPVWYSADFQRHTNPVAGVEPGAADLRQIPAGAQVPRAPFGIRLETAARYYHGFGRNEHRASVLADCYALDAVIVINQSQGAAFVPNFDSIAFTRSV